PNAGILLCRPRLALPLPEVQTKSDRQFSSDPIPQNSTKDNSEQSAHRSTRDSSDSAPRNCPHQRAVVAVGCELCTFKCWIPTYAAAVSGWIPPRVAIASPASPTDEHRLIIPFFPPLTPQTPFMFFRATPETGFHFGCGRSLRPESFAQQVCA